MEISGYNTKREILVPYGNAPIGMVQAYDTLDLTGITKPVIIFHETLGMCFTKFNDRGYFSLPMDVIDALIEESLL